MVWNQHMPMDKGYRNLDNHHQPLGFVEMNELQGVCYPFCLRSILILVQDSLDNRQSLIYF